MATLKKIQALADKIGATLRDESIAGHTVEFTCEAPKGHVWSCDGGIHELVAWQNAGPWGRKDLYADLFERMEYGVEICAIPECEWCNPEDQELVTAPKRAVTCRQERSARSGYRG